MNFQKMSKQLDNHLKSLHNTTEEEKEDHLMMGDQHCIKVMEILTMIHKLTMIKRIYEI